MTTTGRPPPKAVPLPSLKRAATEQDEEERRAVRQKAAEAYKQQAAQVAAAAAAPTQQNTTVIRPAPPAPHHQCSVASAQAGSKPQGGSQLLDLEQLKSAPRFGLNARELILQAAGMVAAEQQPAGPRAAAMAQAGSSARLPAAAAAVAAGVQGVKGPSSSRPRLNGHKLVEAYPPSERPFVQYNPRSCIPRVQRQAAADGLLAQYLVLLVGVCYRQADNVKAAKAVQSNAKLRQLAGKAALAHESQLYGAVTNKQAYAASASKASATRQTLQAHAPPDALAALLAAHKANLFPPKKTGALQQNAGSGAAAQDANTAAEGLADLFGSDSEEDAEKPVPGAQSTASGPSAEQEGPVAGVAAAQQSGGAGEGGAHDTADELLPAVAAPATGAGGVGAEAVEQVVNLDADMEELFGGSEEYDPEEEVQGRGAGSGCPSAGAAGESAPAAEQPGALDQQQEGQKEEGQPQQPAEAQQQQQAGPSCEHSPVHQATSSKDNDEGDGSSKERQGSQDMDKAEAGQEGQEKAGKDEQACSNRKKDKHHDNDGSNKKDRSSGSKAKDTERDKDNEEARRATRKVAEAVTEFVRGLLDPLYRAQLLTKEQYKAVVGKAVEKVMAHHAGAKSAEFLLREHDNVRRYVMRLVEQQRGADKPQ